MQPNHTMIYKCLSRTFVYLMTLTFWNLFYEKKYIIIHDSFIMFFIDGFLF